MGVLVSVGLKRWWVQPRLGGLFLVCSMCASSVFPQQGPIFERIGEFGHIRDGTGAVGDYDNDGDLDLFAPVKEKSRDLLFRNQVGRFEDVAVAANLIQETETENAIWVDYNRDGDLDLFAVPRLLANQGDGSFMDVTQSVGLSALIPASSRLNGGVASTDLNGDGWPDLYIGLHEKRNLILLSNAGVAARTCHNLPLLK